MTHFASPEVPLDAPAMVNFMLDYTARKKCFGSADKNVRYAYQKLIRSFRVFIYMYFDVLQIRVLLIFAGSFTNVLYGHFIIKSHNVCQCLSAVYVF